MATGSPSLWFWFYVYIQADQAYGESSVASLVVIKPYRCSQTMIQAAQAYGLSR